MEMYLAHEKSLLLRIFSNQPENGEQTWSFFCQEIEIDKDPVVNTFWNT